MKNNSNPQHFNSNFTVSAPNVVSSSMMESA